MNIKQKSLKDRKVEGRKDHEKERSGQKLLKYRSKVSYQWHLISCVMRIVLWLCNSHRELPQAAQT